MGINPEFPNYPPGVICTNCVDTLFGGITPLYCMVKLEGIVACPPFPDPLLDGEHILTQTGTPCEWAGNVPPQGIVYRLNVASSVITITGAGALFFTSQILLPCQTLFFNQANCAIPATVSTGGTAEIFWGTDIHL